MSTNLSANHIRATRPSKNGKWQYRAKPGDVMDNYIHLEELNPKTGEVIQNLHLRWPEGAGRE
jgi:hypothetical protein